MKSPWKRFILVSFIGLIGAVCILSVSAQQPGKSSGLTARQRASFPHGKHKHKTIKCSQCHAVSTANPDVTRFPGHSTCISCHEFAEEAVSKRVAFCGICHTKIPLSSAQPALFRFPKPGISSDFGIGFSHVGHQKPLPAKIAPASFQTRSNKSLECQACHKMDPRVKVKKDLIPDMIVGNAHANCFRCHGEEPLDSLGMNQCAGCHKLEVVRSPHLFGIIVGFRHKKHIADIRPKKKKDLAMAKEVDLCSECHSSVAAAKNLKEIKLPEKNLCIDCHTGRVGLPGVLAEDVLGKL